MVFALPLWLHLMIGVKVAEELSKKLETGKNIQNLKKKIINVKNWLENYDIRQKIEVPVNMPENKIKDINGRLITIISMIEMIGQDLLESYGKDESIKEAYQSLVKSREEILKTKQTLPHSD